MKIHFYKYQGTGNDFVILDNRNGDYDALTNEQVAFLCDRRFGVGGDGLMLLQNHSSYDFQMKYYNSDGREGSMCGNGGRCLVKFANDIGIEKSHYKFLAVDGAHEARIGADGIVSLRMNDVTNVIQEGEQFILDTGSPHFVSLKKNVMELDVFNEGRAIRYSDQFKEKGINVNFIEQTNIPGEIIVRTYERGVEDETYSCGTGVTAAAIVASNKEGANRVDVITKGGKLRVSFDKHGDVYSNIWLHGPAVRVFEGEITVRGL